MITFFAVLITLLTLAVIAAVAIIIGGAGCLLVFGDLIVCGLIVYFIIRLIRRRKRR